MHRTRVEFLNDFHDTDTGFSLTISNGGMDRRGSAVLGQQGGMNVDHAMRGNIQNVLRKYLSEGNDNAKIRLMGFQCGAQCRVFC